MKEPPIEAISVELSCDTPASGLKVWQPRRGYRYGVEVYLLTAFALKNGLPTTAIELGSGSGVISLLLASKGISVVGLEREPRWLELSKRSAQDSGLNVAFKLADIRDFIPHRAELCIANPPYFPITHPCSPDPWKASARSQLFGTVSDFVRAGLACAPRLVMVIRPENRKQLQVEGCYIARIAEYGARLLLVELRKGEGEAVKEQISFEEAYGL